MEVLPVTTEMVKSDEKYKMSPEALEVATTYINCWDIGDTADQLSIPKEEVVSFLAKKEVRRIIDKVFLDQGYMNRNKIREKLEEIIDRKLEEIEESELWTLEVLL